MLQSVLGRFLGNQQLVKKRLEIYYRSTGKSPFINWFNKLRDKKIKANIAVRLDYLKLGHYGDCKRIDKAIYELRIHTGAGYRIYFGEYKTSIILLLIGGSKRTQKRDIEKAKQYWQAFNEEISHD
ncbi:MAG: type II toxin-antitoxin system RelE/ParE family toxin [Pseudomonadota bacterium]